MTLERAKAIYVHRYTMEHIPEWAKKPANNGMYYAPQFASDEEWYKNTLFPPHNPLGPKVTDCFTTGQTWPLGKWLNKPMSLKTKGVSPS